MEVWGQAYDAFQSCGTTRLFTCSALLFLVAVLDCCWLDREGVTFPSQKLINSLVHQPLVVSFVYVFCVECRGSIQDWEVWVQAVLNLWSWLLITPYLHLVVILVSGCGNLLSFRPLDCKPTLLSYSLDCHVPSCCQMGMSR